MMQGQARQGAVLLLRLLEEMFRSAKFIDGHPEVWKIPGTPKLLPPFLRSLQEQSCQTVFTCFYIFMIHYHLFSPGNNQLQEAESLLTEFFKLMSFRC